MKYTESFKRQVVKKLMEPGQTASALCQKLDIGQCTIYRWKKEYARDFVCVVEEIQNRPEVDIELLLQASAKTNFKPEENICTELPACDKKASEYSEREKCAIVDEYRRMSKEGAGAFLRKMGLLSRHIELWEEEVLTMAREKTDKDETIRSLEAEKKALQRQIKKLERDNHEMKVIIELKKKYPEIFGRDEEN